MSEALILNLSPRSPDYKSGERTECVVAVGLNLIRWLVDLAKKWLSCEQKIQEKKIQTLKLAIFIHFMRFKENPLPDS